MCAILKHCYVTLRIDWTQDNCASTQTLKLNYWLLPDKDMKISGNHYTYMCVSIHMYDLLMPYSDGPEQGEIY